MITTLVHVAWISRALAAVAALAALMLSAPAARADCPPGNVAETIGQSVFCHKCPHPFVPNAGQTTCVCPQNSVPSTSGGHPTCLVCAPNQVADAKHKKCVTCPAGTAVSFGSCVPNTTTGNPVGWPGLTDKNKPSPPSVATPGLLESTPGLGGSGPAGVGTPRGGGTRGGASAR